MDVSNRQQVDNTTKATFLHSSRKKGDLLPQLLFPPSQTVFANLNKAISCNNVYQAIREETLLYFSVLREEVEGVLGLGVFGRRGGVRRDRRGEGAPVIEGCRLGAGRRMGTTP